jgi:hypothetical protein
MYVLRRVGVPPKRDKIDAVQRLRLGQKDKRPVDITCIY